MKIINTYDQLVAAGGDHIAITYQRNGGRSVMPPWWKVWRIVEGKRVPTQPKGPWYQNGDNVFVFSSPSAEKAPKLLEAIEWANKMFGKRDFVKNRMGDYVEREVNERFPLPKRTP